MDDQVTEDGLPILKKNPNTSAAMTADGLPILKKKASSTAPVTGSPSLPSGLNPFQSSQANTPYSGITTTPEMQQQLVAQDAQNIKGEQERQQALDKQSSELIKDPSFSLNLKHSSDIYNQRLQAQLNDPNSAYYQSKRDQQAERDAADSKLNITLGDRVSAASNSIYRGSGDMLKGAVRAANAIVQKVVPEGRSWDYNHALNNLTGIIDKGVDWAKDYHGLSEEKEAAINRGPINGMINGLAEFAPAIATAERTGGMSFFVNDYEKGYENIDKMSKETGANLSENQKQAFSIVNGAASALLMTHNLHSLMGNLGEKGTDALLNRVTTSAIEDIAKSGEDFSADNVKKAVLSKFDLAENKVKNFGMSAIKGTAMSTGDLSALESVKIGTEHLVNTVTGKKVFDDSNDTERMHSAMQGGAMLGLAASVAKAPLMLAKGSQERNSVIESLYKDPSKENADAIKGLVDQHLSEKGLTPDEIKDTHQTVDELHNVVKTLPKGLAPEKQIKVSDLILQRKTLEDGLKSAKEEQSGLDPAFTQGAGNDDVITQHKIDSINDQIKAIATDTPIKYFRGEDGQPMKQVGDTEPEKIDENRYLIEKPNSLFKAKPNEQTAPNQEVPIEQPTDEAGQTAEAVAPVNEGVENNLTINPNSNEKVNETNGTEASIKGSEETVPTEKEVVKSGEAETKPEITNNGQTDDMPKKAEKAPNQPLSKLPIAEHSELNNILRADHGISIKDLKDEYAQRNEVSESPAETTADEKTVQPAKIDSTGNDGEHRQGSSDEKGKGGTVGSESEGQAKQSLTDAELNRKLELRKKFAGRFNDITNIPTLLADKEFREYAGLVFKEAAGDFKQFSKELIDSVGEKIKEHLPALFKELGGNKEGGGNEVKKTILTKRAYEGEIQGDVKKHLEEKGLTRQSFSQEERSKQATDFINKFGEEAAFRAVESGDIDGGMAASILAQLQIKNSREMGDLPIGSEERDNLAKKQSEYIDLLEKKGYLGGEFNGQLAHEYQNAELDYANVKKQVEKLTGRTLTKEQEAKVKNITSENERLKTKLKEAEAKLIDETDKALTGEDEPAPKGKPKTEYAKKALDAVVNVRAKIRANRYSDATGMVALVDSALATIEAGIRTGMTVTKAIEKGIEYIKSELRKKGTDTWEKEDDFRKDVTDAFADEGIHDTKKERDENDLQQANIKRLEKELANAKENRLKEAPTKREPSEEENDLKEKIKQEKLRISLENMQSAFVDKTDNKFTPSEAKDIWGYMKGKYLENGVSYRDALSKTTEDLGLSWRQVSEAITTPKNKRASDEMWKQQADYARNNNAIKNWIGDQNKSGVWKAWQRVSGLFRGVAVFAHGHIFIGTHAGMTLFNPKTLPLTIKAFFNGWKLSYGKEANYERAMEELKNSPNYLIAQRAGLKNNPERINTEEYQNSQKYLGRLGVVGERGFNAIKILRQDLFDYEFNRLSPAERDDPEVAKSIAHLMNLATGATTLKLPSIVNELTFAGGMEASRGQKLIGSPAKALEVASNAIFAPDKATVADRVFAKVWARRVGTQLATLTGALLANAAIQNTLNPKNPVNFTDPDKPDFLKFKFGDMTIDPTSGMRSTFAFLIKLGKVGLEDDKKLRGEKRSVVVGKDIAKYTLGKLAPVYGTMSDFVNRHDFNNNVMPFSHEKPAKYAHKLTWGEYAWQKAPLPVAEAASVFYQSALEHGAHKKTLDNILKGIMFGAISGSTGFRVGEYDANSKKNKKKH